MHSLTDVEGVLSRDISPLPHSIYVRIFEDPLLHATREFYSVQGETWIARCTAVDFARNVSVVLGEEAARAQAVMHTASTLTKLMRVLDEALIAPHADALFNMEVNGIGESIKRVF